jgi:hypothetical protein
VAALIEFVGGRASLCGHSSGANLAIEATLPVESLAVYEPAFVVDDGRPRPADDLFARIQDHGVLQKPGALAPVLTEFLA